MIVDTLVVITILLILKKYVFYPANEQSKANFEFRFFVAFQLVCLLGFGVLVASYDPTINSVLKRSPDNAFFFSKIIVLLFLILAIIVFQFFEKIENKLIPIKDIQPFNINNAVFILIVLLAVMSTTLLILAYGFPQRLLFSGMAGPDLAYARITTLHNSNLVPSIVRRIFAKDLSIFLSFILYANLLIRKPNRFVLKSKIKLLTYFVIALAIYNTSFELSKSKLVEYFLFLFLINLSINYTCHNIKPKLISLLLVPASLVALLVGFFALVHPEWPIIEVLTYFLSRLFVSQISPFIYTVGSYFNDVTMGEATDIVLYLGEVIKVTDFTAPAQHLTSILFPADYSAGRMNYLSTFMLSDVIWMFGIWAVPISSIYVLFLIRFVIFVKNRTKRLDLAIGLSCFTFYGSNLMSSFSPFVLSASMIFVVLVTLFCWPNFQLNLKCKE